eukprot:11205346-Lingulodinium_polyedra.AAC.1
MLFAHQSRPAWCLQELCAYGRARFEALEQFSEEEAQRQAGRWLREARAWRPMGWESRTVAPKHPQAPAAEAVPMMTINP